MALPRSIPRTIAPNAGLVLYVSLPAQTVAGSRRPGRGRRGPPGVRARAAARRGHRTRPSRCARRVPTRSTASATGSRTCGCSGPAAGRAADDRHRSPAGTRAYRGSYAHRDRRRARAGGPTPVARADRPRRRAAGAGPPARSRRRRHGRRRRGGRPGPRTRQRAGRRRGRLRRRRGRLRGGRRTRQRHRAQGHRGPGGGRSARRRRRAGRRPPLRARVLDGRRSAPAARHRRRLRRLPRRQARRGDRPAVAGPRLDDPAAGRPRPTASRPAP